MNPQIEIFYQLLLQQVVDLVVFIYDGSFRVIAVKTSEVLLF